jgi:tetratricopeptide (TPR) repeat protein
MSMTSPRALVIPFGVPTEGRGLGLGLAALVHSFVHVEGGGVALAQLHERRREEHDGRTQISPVEAFVPPAAWRDIAGRGETPAAVGMVLTGSFEPPTNGQGTIVLLAFDSHDGRTRARVDAPVDDDHAGATVVAALEQLWSGLGGEVGALQGLRELGWDSLESVLRAERCALHDPTRGGPHNRLAALLHLGRAIEDAPEARYPVERLTSIALESAVGTTIDANGAAAAVRALERAVEDAPAHVELVEALAALLLLVGRARDAERQMNAVIANAPRRGRPYGLLAQALRAQGNLEGALAALQVGLRVAHGDPALHAERGAILAERGDLEGASAEWLEALAVDPVHRVAFGHLAARALRRQDTASAQTLVDSALASVRAHPDVLRRAVELSLATEADGLARASRVARMCERILEQMPDDSHASVALARALITLGDRRGARARLAQVDRADPHSAAAAEAQITRLALDDPGADREVQSVLRAARSASPNDLADVAARARRLATLHGAWPGWLAAAIAEQRQGRWVAARGALEVALETAPGASTAHVEIASVLLMLDDAPRALSHVERAMALEGQSPRALNVLARTLAASGRMNEARAVAKRALAERPDDEETQALAIRLKEPSVEDGWGRKLHETWRRWTR